MVTQHFTAQLSHASVAGKHIFQTTKKLQLYLTCMYQTLHSSFSVKFMRLNLYPNASALILQWMKTIETSVQANRALNKYTTY